MALRPLILVPLALALLGACGHRQPDPPDPPPMVVDGFKLNPDPWLKDRQQIIQRASFDLNCSADQLAVRVLQAGGPGVWDDWATQVGVAGCDQRVVYIRTPSGWVANLARIEQPPSQQPPQQPSPPQP